MGILTIYKIYLLECLSFKKRQVLVRLEKLEPLYSVGGNTKWCSHYGKQYRGSSEHLEIELPCDPAIPLLDIFWKKTKTLIQKGICTPMFIVVLFTTAKLRKKPKCSLTDE